MHASSEGKLRMSGPLVRMPVSAYGPVYEECDRIELSLQVGLSSGSAAFGVLTESCETRSP